jgi:hypothetical protein
MQFPDMTRQQFESTFRKPNFLRIYPGQHIIRILGPTIHEEFTHYVNRATIQCIGEGCPVCANNTKLRASNPGKSTRDIQGYSPKRTLYYTNILDRTPVKKCPQCAGEVSAKNTVFPPACPFCETLILEVEAEPSNEVKILSRGVELFEQLKLVQKTTLGKDGEPLGLENFDVQLLVGNNRQPVPSALPNNTDDVEYDAEDLFDLPEVVIKLTETEIHSFLRGVALKDIFLARNATSEEVQTTIQSEISDITDEINDTVARAKSLFD